MISSRTSERDFGIFICRSSPHALTSLHTLIVAIVLGTVTLQAAPTTDPLLHKEAPSFVLTDLNHQRIKLSAYRGHVVLLTFWATWCAPCQIEMPQFVAWQRRYRSDGLQIVGVSMDDDSTPVIAVTRARHVNYPIVMGNEKLGTLYGGILGLPITYLIDRDGIIIETFKGETNLTTMEREIRKTLRKR